MPRYEVRFFNKRYAGGVREVYAVGIDSQTFEINVRCLKFVKEEVREIGIISAKEFLTNSTYSTSKKARLRRILNEWPDKIGLKVPVDDALPRL